MSTRVTMGDDCNNERHLFTDACKRWRRDGDHGESWVRAAICQWRGQNDFKRKTDSVPKSALSPSSYFNVGKSVNFVVPQSHTHNKMGIIIYPLLN